MDASRWIHAWTSPGPLRGFEGLNDDGVAGAWVDRLRFTFCILTSPISFALSALDVTTCARFWEWCWLQLALLERW